MRAGYPPASRGSCCHTTDFLRRSDSSSATTGIRPPAPGGTSAGDSPTSIAAFETQKVPGKPRIAGSLHQANTGGTWATIAGARALRGVEDLAPCAASPMPRSGGLAVITSADRTNVPDAARSAAAPAERRGLLLAAWSGDQVLRLPCDEGFDIVYQLIGEKLHGAVTGPGDMGYQNEVRQAQLQQRVALLGRLAGEDVKAGARDQSLLERLHQRLLIHQPAPSRVDQDGAALHPAEFLDADHVAGLVGQRQVQGNHVALRQYLSERGEYDTGCPWRSMVGKQHVHAEATGDTCRSLPEGTLADEAYGCAVEIANRVVEEAELIDLLPPAILDIPPVSEQVAS